MTQIRKLCTLIPKNYNQEIEKQTKIWFFQEGTVLILFDGNFVLISFLMKYL